MFSWAALQIDWRPWGPMWFVVVVSIAVVAFAIWVYRIDARRLTPLQRSLLMIWRALTIIVILLALMEPSYRLITSEKRPPVVPILIDESLSMSLPSAPDDPFVDFYGEKDRMKRSRYASAVKMASLLIPDLVKTHRVKLYIVSDRIKHIGDFSQGQKVKGEDVLNVLDANPIPTGNFSNLGEGIVDVIHDLSNAKISAVIYMTDGKLTGGISLPSAVGEAVTRGIPLHTIGVGTVEPLPDLKFADLAAPPEANVNDVMSVHVTIINTLRPNLQVELKMFQGDSKTPIATKKLVLPVGEQRTSISTTPTQEGEIKYTLTLPTYPEELDHDNNVVSFHVNVIKRRLKVLFIAGSPTMEYHHIVPSLVRDKLMDVSCWLQTADVNAVQQGNDIIEELPRTPAEWKRYDAVILYDIDPNKFSNEQENGLEQLIFNDGGGLLFIAGRVHGMASLLQVRGAKMEAMLPVEINKNLHPDYDQYFTAPFHCGRTREGERHPIMIFAPSKEKNDEIWQSFSDLEFFWHYQVNGVKRQAVPLITKKGSGGSERGKDCILALMKYGKGTTMFLGIHTLWRWRFPMENYDYDRFWSQTLRYLAEYRMLGAQRQVILTTDKKIYSPGETVIISLSILDPALVNQLRSEQVFVTITDEQKGEYKVLLKHSPKDLSLLQGIFMARRIGEYEVKARHVLAEDIAAKKALFDEKTHFNVQMQSLEFKDTQADLSMLKDIAERSGGFSLDHKNVKERLPKLPAMIDKTPQYVPHESYDDLWDRWYVLIILLGLGTIELWFRRQWGLL